MNTCYLCNSKDFLKRKGQVRDAPDLDILECGTCGLVTLSSQCHISTGHYEQSGMHGGVPETMDRWLHQTAEDDDRRLAMLRTLLPNKQVLDFGCGNGGFLLRAQALAARVVGIELEQRVIDHWSTRLTIFPCLKNAGGGYNLITSFHVVEHLQDPRSILAEMANALLPGGRIVVEVPSADDALLTLYDCTAFQRFSYWSQHLFLFNAETIKQLARQAGLKVVAIQQFQRYPLSNHLFWLSQGQPGGHQHWGFLDVPGLDDAYASALAAIGRCDTIIAHLERHD